MNEWDILTGCDFFFFFFMARKKPCFSFCLGTSGGFMTMASELFLEMKSLKVESHKETQGALGHTSKKK